MIKQNKISIILVLCILLTAPKLLKAQSKTDAAFLNLSFETTYPETEIPMQWYSGSEYGFFFQADTSYKSKGKRSLLVTSTQAKQRWGAMSFLRMMDYELGDSIRHISIQMDIKSDSVSEGYFSPFVWKQEKAGKIIVRNLASDSLKGSKNWQRYEVSDTIGKEIDQDKIFAGIQLNGKGKVWVDNVRLFINGQPVTDIGFNPQIPSQQEIDFIRAHSTPLNFVSPDSSLVDLKALDTRLQNATLVGLGEASHGTAEIFQMKHRIFKYLAKEHGFKTFFLEGHIGASYRINEYIKGGKGDPTELVKNIGFWTWSTQEVLALVHWMRQYNEGLPTEKQLSFIGVDIQGFEEEIAVIDSLTKPFAELNEALMEQYKPILEVNLKLKNRDFFQGFQDSLARLQPNAKIAFNLLKADSINIVKKESHTYHWLHYLADNVLNFVEFTNYQFNRKPEDPFFSTRDSLMAKNIIYALDHLHSEKAVYWAHNLHIANAYDSRLGNLAGRHLKRHYGNQYQTIGFSFEKGNYRAIDGRKGKLTGENFAYPPYPGCFEYLLSKVPAPLFLYDIANSFSRRPEFFEQKTFKQRHLGSYAVDNQFAVRPIHIHYDYLIYMKNTTAAIPIED